MSYVCENGHYFLDGEEESRGCSYVSPVSIEPPDYRTVCPFCGGDYDEAVICGSCGEYIMKRDADDYSGLCFDCYMKVKDEAIKFFRQFNEIELEAMNEIFDCMNFDEVARLLTYEEVKEGKENVI